MIGKNRFHNFLVKRVTSFANYQSNGFITFTSVLE